MADPSTTNRHDFTAARVQATGDISLYDLIRFFRINRTALSLFSLAGLLTGIAYVVLSPAKFEAAASIQMAIVSNEPVELPATLAEKLKLPLYYSDDTFKLCGLAHIDRPGELLANALSPAVNRNAPLVTMSFRAKSPQVAEECIASVLAHVKSNQSKLAEPLISARTMQLNALRARLKEAEALKADLQSKAENPSAADAKSQSTSLLLTAIASTSQEINQLLAEIGKLEVVLSTTQTRPTALATPIYVKNLRSAYNQLVLAVGTAIAGLAIGIVLLAGRNGWRRIKSNFREIT